tara:strand:+ start:3139 stop:3324 length:186 start_codon:yes stop_codon:yes gene_type:complete
LEVLANTHDEWFAIGPPYMKVQPRVALRLNGFERQLTFGRCVLFRGCACVAVDAVDAVAIV